MICVKNGYKKYIYDKEAALKAVEQEGLRINLAYASEELKSDKDVVLIAVKQD